MNRKIITLLQYISIFLGWHFYSLILMAFFWTWYAEINPLIQPDFIQWAVAQDISIKWFTTPHDILLNALLALPFAYLCLKFRVKLPALIVVCLLHSALTRFWIFLPDNPLTFWQSFESIVVVATILPVSALILNMTPKLWKTQNT